MFYNNIFIYLLCHFFEERRRKEEKEEERRTENGERRTHTEINEIFYYR